MKKFIATMMALCMIFALCACGEKENPDTATPEATTPVRTETYRCSLGTASIGGNFNVSGTALANVLNANMDKFEMSVEVTGGSSANISMVENGELEFGFTGENIDYVGRRGEGWANGTKYESIRTILAQNPGAVQIVCDKTQDVHDITDLTGKVISNGTTTGGGVLAANEIYPILGVEYASRQDMGWSDAFTAMGDGLIDVAMDLGGFPAAAFAEYSSTHDVRWVPVTREQAQKVCDVYPYYAPGTIPAGTYACMDEDYDTIFTWYKFITHVDTDADLVYEICKTVFENKADLVAGAASFEWLDPSNVQNLATPLHVGAIRYYEEMGIELPETAYGPEYQK